MVLPGSSIGRYLVKRKLAEGGMAELFLCASRGPEGFEKEVVIKRIKAFLSDDPTFIEMFMAEARVASRLNHVNVVQIFDFDKHEDAWFIAMEYVHGASLWELRRRCRELGVPLPPTLVAEIGAQTARGLHYAHTLSDKGKPLTLVHRDVTPHNVLLSFDGAVKLTDFGIAKAGTSFTAPGMLKGKFAYMSPEQARGEKVDSRTDIFALGITLWEMLTGGRLFEGDSDLAVLRAVQESQIAPPTRLNLDVPVELSEIVLKALARPLDARFQSAQELERALANFVLKNAASTEDTNIGLYLRQMFRDELEEAERAMAADPEFASTGMPGTQNSSSQTPIIDAYALGGTLFKNRHAEQTEQTATPVPAVPAPAERPKTAQMPGVRPSKPLVPLMDADDGSVQRTEQMAEVGAQPRVLTAQQPGLRPSRKKLEPLPPEVPLPATTPGRMSPLADATARLPTVTQKKSLLPWLVGACAAVGLVAAVGVGASRSKPPAVAEVVEIPAPVPAPAPPAQPDAPTAIEAARADEPKVELPAAVRPEEPAGAVEVRPAPAAEPAKAKGVLVVEAIPFGTLYVNNKQFAEVEGTKRFPFAPGTYALRFEHPRRVENLSVTIRAGQSATFRFHPLEK